MVGVAFWSLLVQLPLPYPKSLSLQQDSQGVYVTWKCMAVQSSAFGYTSDPGPPPTYCKEESCPPYP